MLIEFTEEEHASIKELATGHGMGIKPFIEFIVKVQSGLTPEPKPIKMIPLHVSTYKDTRQEPTEGPTEGHAAGVPAVAQEGKPEQITNEETQEGEPVKEADKAGQFFRRFGKWSNGKCYRKQNEDGSYIYSYI